MRIAAATCVLFAAVWLAAGVLADSTVRCPGDCSNQGECNAETITCDCYNDTTGITCSNTIGAETEEQWAGARVMCLLFGAVAFVTLPVFTARTRFFARNTIGNPTVRETMPVALEEAVLLRASACRWGICYVVLVLIYWTQDPLHATDTWSIDMTQGAWAAMMSALMIRMWALSASVSLPWSLAAKVAQECYKMVLFTRIVVMASVTGLMMLTTARVVGWISFDLLTQLRWVPIIMSHIAGLTPVVSATRYIKYVDAHTNPSDAHFAQRRRCRIARSVALQMTLPSFVYALVLALSPPTDQVWMIGTAWFPAVVCIAEIPIALVMQMTDPVRVYDPAKGFRPRASTAGQVQHA